MKCAVVDAYSCGRFLPAALRRYGAECIHVRSQFPDIYLTYRPEDFTVNVQHGGNLASTIAVLANVGVEYVVAGAESGVELADALSAALGTPGNGMRRPAARRHKYEMVRAVQDAGLATAASMVSRSAEQIVEWASARRQWPVVLKPLASAGTDHVIYCHSTEEIRAAHATILASTDRYARHNEAVLAQQFLVGAEYFVNTVSRDGVHHIVEIWRYHKRRVTGGRPVYDYEHPVPPDEAAVGTLSIYVLAVLDALEIRNGAGHTEVMLTQDGPVLVECGARLGGSHLPHVVSRCFGTDQVECAAMAIAQPSEFARLAGTPYRLRTQLRYVSLLNPRDGVVPSYEGFAPVRSLPTYADMALTLPAGPLLPRTVDVATSPGYVYLMSDSLSQIEADYQRLRELEETVLYGANANSTRPG